MSRVLIVGASSYLGGRIAVGLNQLGHEVIFAYRSEHANIAPFLNKFASVRQGDVTDPEYLRVLSELNSDYVVYLVSLNHHDSEKNYQYSIGVNTAPLAELSRLLSHKPNFKRLVYLSTFQVYGCTDFSSTITEDFPTKPLNMYGWTHLQCESALAFLNKTKGFNSVSLRLSNGFGAPVFLSNDCWWLVLNDFCKSAVANGHIKLKSDGSPQRDFIHVSDVTQAIHSIFQTDRQIPTVMNLASGRSLTMLELANTVSSVYESKFGRDVPVYLPDGTKSLGTIEPIERLKISIEKMERVLKWKPSVSIKDGVNELFQFIQKNTKRL